MVIWFDMDGTFVDLYGVENWLEKLRNHSEEPYEVAKPLFNMNSFARCLNYLQRKGYKIGIISWLAKEANAEYDEKVTEAKKKWLKKHLKSVRFDYIDIVPYGTPKHKNRNGFLFDDDFENRKNWGCDCSFDAVDILETLRLFY